MLLKHPALNSMGNNYVYNYNSQSNVSMSINVTANSIIIAAILSWSLLLSMDLMGLDLPATPNSKLNASRNATNHAQPIIK